MVSLEENFKWHLEAFASELFIYINIYIYSNPFYVMGIPTNDEENDD